MRFYFDIEDDFYSMVDSEGGVFSGVEAARKEAILMATSIARDVFSADGSNLTITVRNEDASLFELKVTLSWKNLA